MFVIALLIFGPNRLPQAGRTLGRGRGQRRGSGRGQARAGRARAGRRLDLAGGRHRPTARLRRTGGGRAGQRLGRRQRRARGRESRSRAGGNAHGGRPRAPAPAAPGLQPLAPHVGRRLRDQAAPGRRCSPSGRPWPRSFSSPAPAVLPAWSSCSSLRTRRTRERSVAGSPRRSAKGPSSSARSACSRRSPGRLRARERRRAIMRPG